MKRRVGKKMPTEKRERLEEVATVLVREMGWATGDEINVKRSATPSSVKPQHPALPQDQDPSANVPGTGAFGVSGYEHHNPYPSHKHAHHHHPQSASQYTASPFGDMGYPQPSMERRTSSCPPPGAHMTWADASATQTHTPPATSYGGMYPPPPPMPQPQAWAYPAPQAPYSIAPAPAPASTGYTVVRPGGKTARKMRTGPGSAKAQALNGKGASPASSSGGKKLPSKAATIDGGAMTLPSLHTALKTTNTEVPMSTGTGFDLHAQDAHWGQGYVSRKPLLVSTPHANAYPRAHFRIILSNLLLRLSPAALLPLCSWKLLRSPTLSCSTTQFSRGRTTRHPRRRSTTTLASRATPLSTMPTVNSPSSRTTLLTSLHLPFLQRKPSRVASWD